MVRECNCAEAYGGCFCNDLRRRVRAIGLVAVEVKVYRHSDTDDEAKCLVVATPHLVREQQDECDDNSVDDDAPDSTDSQCPTSDLVRRGLLDSPVLPLPGSLVCCHLARMVKPRARLAPEGLVVPFDLDRLDVESLKRQAGLSSRSCRYRDRGDTVEHIVARHQSTDDRVVGW